MSLLETLIAEEKCATIVALGALQAIRMQFSQTVELAETDTVASLASKLLAEVK